MKRLIEIYEELKKNYKNNDIEIFGLINSEIKQNLKDNDHPFSTRAKNGIKDEIEDNICVICHESLINTEVIELRCGHVFNTGCIIKWF